jgi:ribosomal protein S18 acetylase RimI-like enzyme
MTFRRLQSSDAIIYQQIRRHALNEMPQFVGPLAEQEALSELTQLQSCMDGYESEGIFPFGCFLDAECAGVAALTRKLHPKYSHKLFLWGMYILPAYRGRSIGRHFMEHLLSFAHNLNGVRFVILQVTTSNAPARVLYQRFGFVSCGIEPQAIRLGEMFHDFEMMQLDLNHVPHSR